VPCAQAALAKYDLTDTNLGDDQGPPRTTYWCHNGTVAHEERHRSNWEYCYTPQLAIAIATAESVSVEIDCGKSDSIDCGSVETSKIGVISNYFDQAHQTAVEAFDDPSTSTDEADVFAYMWQSIVEGPIADALPGGCTP